MLENDCYRNENKFSKKKVGGVLEMPKGLSNLIA